MARNDKSRQRKLMNKRRKDKLRHKTRAGLSLSQSDLERKRILEARSYPVHECLIEPGWQEHGLTHILLSRTQPDGNLVVGVYLVDVLCLGLKNTFARANISTSAYNTGFRDAFCVDSEPEICPVDLAHTIIFGGIDYARQFGFQPHKDFKLSRHILQDRSLVVPRADVEFGRDGKPLYVSGPHDDAMKIMRQLQAAAGEGNYHFMVGGPVG